MPSAIRYIRFSSDQQQHGSSVTRQQGMIDKWLAEHPEYELSALSSSDLGKSAFKGEHLQQGAGLQTIIQGIKESKIKKGDAILVEAIDRLGRMDAVSMLQLLTEILQHNIDVITLEHGQTYTYSKESLSNNMGDLYMLVGKIQAAHNYSKTLSERVSAAFQRKRNDLANGRKITFVNTPWWLNREGRLIPEKADIVRWIIDGYKSGKSIRELTKTLPDQFGVSLSRTGINSALSSRALYGVYQDKARTMMIQDAYQAVLDVAEYQEIQQLRAGRGKTYSKKPDGTPSITPFVRCGCGNGMHSVVKNGYKYLRCNSYGRPDGGCKEKQYPYQIFQWGFYYMARFALQQWAKAERRNDYTEDLADIDIQLDELNEQVESLTDLYIATQRAQLKKRISELQRVIDELEKRRGALSLRAAGEETAFNLRDEYFQSDRLLKDIVASEQKFLDLLRLAKFQLLVFSGALVSNNSQQLSIQGRKRAFSAHLIHLKNENEKRSYLVKSDGSWCLGNEQHSWSPALDRFWSYSPWSLILSIAAKYSGTMIPTELKAKAEDLGLEFSSMSEAQQSSFVATHATEEMKLQIVEAVARVVNIFDLAKRNSD